MSTTPAQESPPGPPPPRQPSRLRPPGKIVIGLIGLCLIGIGLIRGLDIVQDAAVVNILTLVLSFVVCVTLTVWFTLQSGLALHIRLLGLNLGVAAIALFFVFFKFGRVSGELIPEFRPRFEVTNNFPFLRPTRAPDERLEMPQPEAQAAAAPLEPESMYDYPGFLGANRSAAVDWPEVKLARNWKSVPPREVWREKIGAGWSAFAVSGPLAFTLEQRGENELVTCYAAETGKLVWSHTTKARHFNVMGAVGPRSTPTVAGQHVYTLGATGVFLCLKAATGEVVWEHDLLEMYDLTSTESEKDVAWGRSNSPLVDDDLVIVPGARGPGGKGAGLVTFNRETGAKVWEGGKEQVSYASPELGTLGGVRQVLIVNESTVSGHELDTGRELWQTEWLGHSNSDANASQAHALPGDRVFVSKGYSGGGALFSVNESAGKWTATELWYEPTNMKTKFTNVAIYNGYVYGLSDSVLECISLETGARQWKKGRYRQGQLLRVNDCLLVQAESGEVFLVAADPAGHKELGRVSALSGQTWNNPALFCREKPDGLHCYLLVRNAEEAACYELPLEK